MSVLEAADDLDLADGLRALFRGDEGDEADLGALFLTRTLLKFVTTQGG